MRVKLWGTAIALVTLAGCGHRSGFLRDASTGSERQFRMDVAARRYSRSVSGSSSVGSLFCVIPLSNGAYREAMAALHAQAKLQTNEVLENIREDHAFLTLIVYCGDSLILSADVYDVVPTRAPTETWHAESGVCDPPYSIDAQGREIFKSECLPSDPEPTDPSKAPPTRPELQPAFRPPSDAGALEHR